ncbi:DEAD/DEAH box helicase [Corynebacterium glyciniphilum]|uniref:DEAD/DEAH box helicase n=1 Tax=Corynebacterium glyciniphilum TaxID=1404244 RepID=UPI0026509070|nr:DEAD/DEAH box helicase [Corynebacterium glyciniphilum]MDN5683544.1 DEAD/DEAH box helicase [Corynebacterium glyciniphilum]
MIPLAIQPTPRLQATYLPDEYGFAWWGVPDIPSTMATAGLPAGRMTTTRLVVPDGETLSVEEVDVCVTDLTTTAQCLSALTRVRHLDDSARAWRTASRFTLRPPTRRGRDADEAFAEVAATLPPAGHAVPTPDGTAIPTAGALIARFRTDLDTAEQLHTGQVQADLRPYQAHGVSWLRDRVRDDGGAVLADDMGLGKTLQFIALLATRPAVRPHLVVCPTSLLGNWARELQRFAPHMEVLRYHGSARRLPDDLPAGTVVLTSYPLLRSDHGVPSRRWDMAVFDEAQQLKNPTSQVTRTAVDVDATARIIMTGTPVENNLDELWSLFSVAVPQVLGTRPRFRTRFATPNRQRQSRTAAARLSDTIAPYMLRRTKGEVALELPERLDSTVICGLTPVQRTLYRDAVTAAFTTGFHTGAGRSGQILTLPTSLKQICNHPDQYLRKDDPNQHPDHHADRHVGRSAKFDRVAEMVDEIVAGEYTLVFTQYRAMGEILAAGLAEQLGCDPLPFLHGGLPAAERDEMVRRFQEDEDAPPVLILSLRAAGFGLNLTRASHVIHYDRWWNPAVEEQATARAHRIGQKNRLSVHTMVVGGTFEDYIEKMHRAKKGLVDAVTGDDSAELTSISDEELHDVLELKETYWWPTRNSVPRSGGGPGCAPWNAPTGHRAATSPRHAVSPGTTRSSWSFPDPRRRQCTTGLPPPPSS